MPLFKLNFSNPNFTYGVFQIERTPYLLFYAEHELDYIDLQVSSSPVFFFDIADYPRIEIPPVSFLFNASVDEEIFASINITSPSVIFDFQAEESIDIFCQILVDIKPSVDIQISLESLTAATVSLRPDVEFFFDVFNPIIADLNFSSFCSFEFYLYEPCFSTIAFDIFSPKMNFKCMQAEYGSMFFSIPGLNLDIYTINKNENIGLFLAAPSVNFDFSVEPHDIFEEDIFVYNEIIRFEYTTEMFLSSDGVNPTISADDVICFYARGTS